MCINSTDYSIPRITDVPLAHFVAGGVAVLSVLCSVLTGLVYFVVRWNELRMGVFRTTRHLVFSLSIACLFLSLSNAAFINFDWQCRGQAFFTTASTLSYVFWNTAVAFYHFRSRKHDLSHADRSVFEKRSHLLNWGVPVVVACVALACQALGSTWSRSVATAGWCWISTQPALPANWSCQNARLFWMLLSLKTWEIMSYVLVVVFYLAALNYSRRARSQAIDSSSESDHQSRLSLLAPSLNDSESVQLSDYSAMRRQPTRTVQEAMLSNQKLAYFPILYFVTRLWGTVRTVTGYTDAMVEDSGGEDTLLMLQGIGDNCQGILLFIFFVVLEKNVRGKLPNPAMRPRVDSRSHVSSNGKAVKYREALRYHSNALREKIKGHDYGRMLWSRRLIDLDLREQIESKTRCKANDILLAHLVEVSNDGAVLHFVDIILDQQPALKYTITHCPGKTCLADDLHCEPVRPTESSWDSSRSQRTSSSDLHRAFSFP